MTKLLTVFLSLVLLSACTQIPVEPAETPYGNDGLGDDEPDFSDIGDPQDGPMGYDVEESINEDGSYTFTTISGGEEVAQIEKEKPVDGYNAYIFDDIGEFVYVAIDPTGLGGYILYTGAYELYEVDTSTGDVRQLPEETAGFATDLSDEGNLAYVLSNEVGEHFVLIRNVESNEIQNFQVSDEFDKVGDATFSPDGSKLAYQATITSNEPNDEETAVFVIDLVTGEQTEFARQEGLYEIVWQDNDRPIVD